MLLALALVIVLMLIERVCTGSQTEKQIELLCKQIDEHRDQIRVGEMNLEHARRHLTINTKTKQLYAERLAQCVEALKTCQIYKPDAPGGPAWKEYDTALVAKAMREVNYMLVAERRNITERMTQNEAQSIQNKLA